MFNESYITAIVNLKDPDTIQCPILAEFDSVFLSGYFDATVDPKCPPAPITVFAYIENLLTHLLNSQRDVHLIISIPNSEYAAWSHAPSSVQLLRNLVYGHLCKLTQKLQFHKVYSINDIDNICNNFRPGVYLNGGFPKSLHHFPQKFSDSINAALHLAKCLFLERNLSVLSIKDLKRCNIHRLPVFELKQGSKNLTANLDKGLYFNTKNEIAEIEKKFLDFDSFLGSAYSLVRNKRHLAAWIIHRNVLKRIAIKQRAFKLKSAFSQRAGLLIEEISRLIIGQLKKFSVDPSEFIDLYDPKLLSVILENARNEFNIDGSKNRLEFKANIDVFANLGDGKGLGFLAELKNLDIHVLLNDECPLELTSIFKRSSLFDKHWHNDRELEVKSQTKLSNAKFSQENKQQNANYNQKFSESFRHNPLSERRILSIPFAAIEPKTECTRKEGGGSKHKKSNSAQVKERIKIDQSKKVEKESSKKIATIVSSANTKTSFLDKIECFESELSTLTYSSVFEQQIYIELCAVWSKQYAETQQIESKIGFFAVVRDTWRFYALELSEDTKKVILEYFNEMGFSDLYSKLKGDCMYF